MRRQPRSKRTDALLRYTTRFRSAEARVLGLLGARSHESDSAQASTMLRDGRNRGVVTLLGDHEVAFSEGDHVRYRPDELLPVHSNGMRFVLKDERGGLLLERQDRKSTRLNSSH